MLTEKQVLETLESLGKEQTRKTYRRHGVQGALFGVLGGDMKKLHKQIKVNHPMALSLWATGNYDARIFALLIADPQQADETTLDAWARELDSYPLSDAFSAYVVRTPFARQKLEEWTQSDVEWVGQAGWNLLARTALDDQTLPDDFFLPYLDIIRSDIHNRKNRVRQSMNGALIAMGGRNPALEQAAIAAAQHIGKVHVDHGDTDCKTPDAVSYIQKMKARRN